MANFEKFALQNEIGRGSFGVVFKGRWRSRPVAIKILDIERQPIACEMEITLMAGVRHPNLIELFAISMHGNSKYLIMEYAENGTLDDLLHGIGQRKYTTLQAIEWALQCAEGVAYLHNLNEPIILRYMNPKTLLLTDRHRKLKITNLCRVALSRAGPTTERNNCAYEAPEIYDGLTCSNKCDVFSWAIVFWEILARKKPYNEFEDGYELCMHKFAGERPPFVRGMLDNVKLLLIKCWNQFYNHRPPMVQVVFETVKILSQVINSQIMKKETPSTATEIPIEDVKQCMFFPDVNGSIKGLGLAKWGDRDVFVRLFDYTESRDIRAFRIMYSQLSQISHPNIIELLGISTKHKKEPEGVFKLLIMDYFKNGSLSHFLYGKEQEQYTPSLALEWALQCAQALEYIHNMKSASIFRANVNPAVVMLSKDRRYIKICDFQTDIYLTDHADTDHTYIDAYLAPEIILGHRYSRQSDVFSWAHFLWEVLKRERPMPGECLQPDYGWPVSIKDFLYWCEREPDERPSMHNVVSKMKEIIESGWDVETKSIIKSYKFSGPNFEEFYLTRNSHDNRFQWNYKGSWLKRPEVVKYLVKDNELNVTIRRLLNVAHENILQIFCVALPSKYQKHLVCEFADNGNLHDFLHGEEKKHYSWKQAFDWAHQCASGIAYLHNLEIHLALRPDIRPCKLLLTNQFRQLKIYKFNVDMVSLIEKNYSPTGYIAPEVFETLTLTKECDVFSWGALLCEILTRKEPFKHRTSKILLDRGDGKNLLALSPHRRDLPESISDLIGDCCAQGPDMANVISRLRDIEISVPFKGKTSYLQDEPSGLTIDVNFDNFINTQRIVPNLESKDITFGKALGRGSFGIVHKAKWRHRTVAVKEIDTRTDDLKQAFKTELQQLLRVTHRNIIKLIGTSAADHLKFLVIEYAKDGSLDSFLHGKKQRQYTKGRALSWALQCADGIAYLHNLKPHPVMHRDLKPHNLLITRRGRRLKICDFGTVVELKTKMTTGQGTPHYMAPEVFEGGRYTEKCDVFSWAIILWEILKRERPFKEFENVCAIQYQKRTKGLRPTIPENWSVSISQLITSCWCGEPDERPSMSGAITDLKDIMVKDNERHSYAFSQGSHNTLPSIPSSDLKFDKTPIKRGSTVFKKMFKGYFGKRSVVIQETSIKTDEMRTVFNQLSQASHPNIIKLFGVCSEYLIVEYAQNSTLDYFLHSDNKSQYTKVRALSWALQCAEGIDFLHKMKPQSFVHSLLMPKYLLLTKNYSQLKISVFGEGVPLTSEQPTRSNIEMYLPPEAVKGEVHTKKCNVFTWGIILWEMLKREKPYNSEKNGNIVARVEKLSGITPRVPLEWSDSIKSLLITCWRYDPESRCTMESVIDEMKQMVNKPLKQPAFVTQNIVTPEAQVEVFML